VDHMGLAYSMTDLEMALYVLVRVSWDLPQVVEVRAFRTEIDFLAFSAVREICSEKLSLGSKVTPRTLGFLLVGMVMLFMESDSWVLYSAGSGVKRVEEDLSGFRMRSFWIVQSKMELRYGWRLA